MIDLDDPIWADLEHAYGSAANIPDEIRHIESTRQPTRKFWDELHNVLCHQCMVCSASFAAFPHLVRIATNNPNNRKGLDSLSLAAVIFAYAVVSENKIPKMPKVLSQPFHKAISDGQQLIESIMFKKKRSFRDTMLMSGIAGEFAGQPDVFLLLEALSVGWWECPECEERFKTERLYVL